MTYVRRSLRTSPASRTAQRQRREASTRARFGIGLSLSLCGLSLAALCVHGLAALGVDYVGVWDAWDSLSLGFACGIAHALGGVVCMALSLPRRARR